MKPGSGCSDPAEQSTGSEQCRTFFFLVVVLASRAEAGFEDRGGRDEAACYSQSNIPVHFISIFFLLGQVCCCCCSHCCVLRFDLLQQRSRLFA